MLLIYKKRLLERREMISDEGREKHSNEGRRRLADATLGGLTKLIKSVLAQYLA